MERARDAATRILLQTSKLHNVSDGMSPFLVVQQLSYKLCQTAKSVDNRLSNHPRFYAAMVHALLPLGGVHVKMARTAAGANDSLHEVRTIVKGRDSNTNRVAQRTESREAD